MLKYHLSAEPDAVTWSRVACYNRTMCQGHVEYPQWIPTGGHPEVHPSLAEEIEGDI